ncbi:uncharacterized protein METZ01_LOCUS388697, partial [marine metagenome]
DPWPVMVAVDSQICQRYTNGMPGTGGK